MDEHKNDMFLSPSIANSHGCTGRHLPSFMFSDLVLQLGPPANHLANRSAAFNFQYATKDLLLLLVLVNKAYNSGEGSSFHSVPNKHFYNWSSLLKTDGPFHVSFFFMFVCFVLFNDHWTVKSPILFPYHQSLNRPQAHT